MAWGCWRIGVILLITMRSASITLAAFKRLSSSSSPSASSHTNVIEVSVLSLMCRPSGAWSTNKGNTEAPLPVSAFTSTRLPRHSMRSAASTINKLCKSSLESISADSKSNALFLLPQRWANAASGSST